MITDCHTTKSISRIAFVDAVEAAVVCLHEPMDRDAVREFARTEPRFVAGTWSLGGNYCPSSGVGIDRFRDDAQEFAIAFDNHLGVTNACPWLCTVEDA
jgi:hypothetical protein